MNVRKVIEYFGGDDALTATLELVTGETSSSTRIAVWKSRGHIPSRVLLALMIHDPGFNPAEFGWTYNG